MINFLLFLPPILAIFYRWFEYKGVVDKITGRHFALEGLRRLNSGAGHPVSWIYNKDHDQLVFLALEKRISKNTSMEKIKKVIDQGFKPSLISTAGIPMQINGVPNEWPQEERCSYLPNQPVLYVFDSTDASEAQKGDKACTLAELESWLQEEKDGRLFWLGVVFLGMISIILLIIRLSNAS